MKRINFNIKDRKILMLGLCLILVCVFILTIAYAALNAVLTIQGNAEVVGSNWDIYLENPVVKSGSSTTDVPIITSGRSLTFNTTLNMPGDFYEFTVDVVNSGSIDAMIEKVTKTPELTVDQTKYLKYEVSYQNGESITNKQAIASGVTMPIKVRIEYRKDLTGSDLPTGQVQLNFGLVLDYIQSDGTGSSVTNNGVQVIPYIGGSVDTVGNIVRIGSEYFYVIGSDVNNVKLLSMYNLYVGNTCVGMNNCVPFEEGLTTGMQHYNMRGSIEDARADHYGTTPFATDEIKGANYSDYEGSLVKTYVDNYQFILEQMGITVLEARILTLSELNSLGCSIDGTCTSSNTWVYSTSYWIDDPSNVDIVKFVRTDGYCGNDVYFNNYSFGVRPVIVIPKNIMTEVSMIKFTVDGNKYRAEEGMTWGEWINSGYCDRTNFGLVDGDIFFNWYDGQWMENIYTSKTHPFTMITVDDVIISDFAYYAS